MAITKILIREHYWLNDMEIDCVNSATGKPYKCIILAGENGTGKSTLFNLLLTKQMNNIYYPDSNSTDSTGIIIECDAYTIFYKIEEQQSEVAGSSVSNIRMNNINNLEYPVKNILNGLIRNMETESLKKIKEYSNTSKTAREVMDEIQSPLLIFQKYFDIFFKDSNLTMEINYTTLQVNFKRNGKFFNIENLSDGEKRILSFSGKLIASGKDITDSVIIIDEPDDKLHFKWQEKILKHYLEIINDMTKNTQLLISTHSEYVVKDAISCDDTLLVVLKRDKNEKITPYLYSKNIKGMDYFILNEPTYAEIIYKAYKIPTTQFFDELYNSIEDLLDSTNHKKFDICVIKNFPQIEKHKYIAKMDRLDNNWGDISEIVYVRQMIHHPNNFDIKVIDNNNKNGDPHINKKISLDSDKMSDLIDKLIAIYKELKNNL